MSGAVETPCGRVRLTPPKLAGGYWRVEWYEHGKRRQSTGGRTLEAAREKAQVVVDRLDKASQPLGRTRMEEVLDRYLVWGQEQWSRNHYVVTKRELTKVRSTHGRLRAEQLDAVILRELCNAFATRSGANAQRSGHC